MKTRFKELAFLAILAVFIPISMSAQKSDGFFRGGNDDYQDRETFVINGNSEGGLSNYGIGETVPVGSGLFIMLTAGAGYVVLRRKKAARKCVTLLLALTMVLSFTQCKKKLDTINPTDQQTVNITLDVSGGSRVNVDPYWEPNATYASVEYELGDVVHVAYNKEYVGQLTYQYDEVKGKNVFKGGLSITPVEDEPLYFFFLGNGYLNSLSDPNEKLVLIRDQTRTVPGKFPVISWAASDVIYSPSIDTYTARLQNVCSIVKFNIISDKVQEGDEIIITGLKEYVYVDFANHSFSFDYSNDDNIDNCYIRTKVSKHNDNLECWVILLPQDATEAGKMGSVYSADGQYLGIRSSIPAIQSNQYLDAGIDIVINTDYPTNAFSVSRGRKVFFSQGNLQYKASTETWRFAEHDWNFVGSQATQTFGSPAGNVYENNVLCDNANIADDYGGWIDLFGWGTGDEPTKLSMTNGNYSWSEWGENSITNGNGYTWFTLSEEEYLYLFADAWYGEDGDVAENRIDKWGTARIYDDVADCYYNGLVILPDLWTDAPAGCNFNPGADWTKGWEYNTYTMGQWASMKAAGAVFLPAGGSRGSLSGDTTKDVDCVNYEGRYWTSTIVESDDDDWKHAYNLHFTDDKDEFGLDGRIRRIGNSVRLVRDINTSNK